MARNELAEMAQSLGVRGKSGSATGMQLPGVMSGVLTEQRKYAECAKSRLVAEVPSSLLTSRGSQPKDAEQLARQPAGKR